MPGRIIAALFLALVTTSAPAADDPPALRATPPPTPRPTPRPVPRLDLDRVVDAQMGTIDYGTFTVWENRDAAAGRTLDLDLVVLRARAAAPRPDPVFVFAGGPGVAVAEQWRRFAASWIREDRDLVLLSQRGTGGSNRLDCSAPGSADDLQGYLDGVFSDAEAFVACLETLRTRADLRWYGTATAMDDIDELRRALGYDVINVRGGSYGSRAALEYVRRYGAHVRTATLNGVAPVEFVNPLYHAAAAQRVLDLIFAECAADPACAAAHPDLPRRFADTLARLDAAPARVRLTAGDGRDVELILTRAAYAEAVRLLMYFDRGRLPHLVSRAADGDYATFVRAGFDSNRSVRDIIAFGMLLCVTCGEDVPRIDPALVDELTRGTFLGDARVREQMAVCAAWPASTVPPDHGAPLVSDVPMLLLSGRYDPVTPPRFAEALARRLPHAVHVVAPGSHGVGGPCIAAIERAFLERGSVEGLDTSCVERMTPSPFYVAPGPPARPGPRGGERLDTRGSVRP